MPRTALFPTHTEVPITTEITSARLSHPSVCDLGTDRLSVVRDLIEKLGDKWTLFVVGMLEDGPVRYKDLRARIPGISQRMLTLTLKKLERDGLVSRHSYPEIPPRVEYSLTDLGRTLLAPANAFMQWALAHAESVEAARADYDGDGDGDGDGDQV